MRVGDCVTDGTSRAARRRLVVLLVASAALVGATAGDARAADAEHTCGCPCATPITAPCAPAADGPTSGKADDDDDVIVPRPIGDSTLPLLPTTRRELRELSEALEQQRWGVALDTVGVLTCALGTAFFIPLDNNHRVGDFSTGATLGAILLGGGVTTIILGAVTYQRGSDREAAVAARVAARLLVRAR